jgi:HTH-type transcriptional regulator/antitoxin HigA
MIMDKINKDADYNKIMTKINSLMAKGSKNVTDKELVEIRELALVAQKYEQNKYVIEAPTTLAGMIEMKMYELKLKQKELAEKLHVSNAKLSLILNGKQKPDVEFLKSVYSELHVDAEFLLKHA